MDSKIENTKVMRLLRAMTPNEIRDCNRYLNSDFVKIPKKVIQLYQLLVKHTINKKRPIIKDKRKLYELLYEEKLTRKQAIPTKINDILYKLSNHLEIFIAWKSLNNMPFRRSFLVAEVAKKRGKTNLFLEMMKKAKATLKTKYPSGWLQLLNLWRLEHLVYFHPATQKVKTETNNKLKKLLFSFDTFLSYIKLRYYTEAQTRDLFFDESYEVNFIDPIRVHLVKSKELIANPLLKGYQLTSRLINEPSDETYNDLKSWFDGILALVNAAKIKIEKEELLEFYKQLGNYCGLFISQGKSLYVNRLFELFQTAIQKRFLYYNNQIAPHLFITTVDVGLACNEYQWVVKFIKESENAIPKSYRSNTLLFSSLYLLKYKNDLTTVREKLKGKSFEDDRYFTLRAKKLELMVVYDLIQQQKAEKEDDIFRLISNFERLLAREQSLQYEAVITGNKNFIKMLKKLMDVPYNKKLNKAYFLEMFENMKYLSNRIWVFEKIKSLS